MKILYGGSILRDGAIRKGQAVLFDHAVRAILPESEVGGLSAGIERVAFRGLLVPGFIDIHIHGSAGSDVMDASEEALATIARSIARTGTTSFLAATMTMEYSKVEAALSCARRYRQRRLTKPGGRGSGEGAPPGAELLGVHLEGPFINERYKGAQNAEHVRTPDIRWAEEQLDIVRMITLAPEVPGAMEFIERLSGRCVIALGHSAADYECACAAQARGAGHITHCFNAMTGLHHRKPGLAGAALIKDFSADFIADGIHIHPELLGPILRIKRRDRRVLITDAIRAASLGDGSYDLGGQEVTVRGDVASLKDGTIAGSVLTMDRALRNMLRHTDFSLPEIVEMMTLNPARVLGIEDRKGRIEVGADADLVVMNEEHHIENVYIQGEKQ